MAPNSNQVPTCCFRKVFPLACLLALVCSHLKCQDITSARFFKLNFNTLSSPNSIISNMPSTLVPAEYEPSHLIEAELRFPVKLKGKTRFIGALGYNRELLSGFYIPPGDDGDIDLVSLHRPSLSVYILHNFGKGLGLKASLGIQSRANRFLEWNSQALAYRTNILLEKKKGKNAIGFGTSLGYNNNRFSIVPILLYQKELSGNWSLDLLLPAKALLVKSLQASSRLLFGFKGDTADYFFTRPVLEGYDDLSYRRLNVNVIAGYERQLTPMIGIGVEAGVTAPLRSGLYQQNGAWNEVHNFGRSVAPYFNMKFFLSLPN